MRKSVLAVLFCWLIFGAIVQVGAQSHSVTITFTPATGAASYNLYRGTTAGGEAATPILKGITTSPATDSNVTPGTTYFYEMTSVTSSGAESGFSNETSCTIGVNPPTNVSCKAN